MKKHYDVIVAGGGFAGAAAAISAAREGADVLLIEKFNCMGGSAAYSLVSPFMPFFTKTEGGRLDLCTSIFGEIFERLVSMGAVRGATALDPVFEVEYLKKVLNDMAREAGVKLLYQAYLTDAEVEDGKIKSVTVSSVSGKLTFTADVFIDATGDANLSYLWLFFFAIVITPYKIVNVENLVMVKKH